MFQVDDEFRGKRDDVNKTPMLILVIEMKQDFLLIDVDLLFCNAKEFY